jgi:type II restriction enzyme
MELALDFNLAKVYRSSSQKIRVITEGWTGKNAYCPYCGKLICHYGNNRPVADFYCDNDHEEFELKSKEKTISLKIVGAQYDKMIERITSEENPNLFLLSYFDKSVNNFCVIPKYLLTPHIIEKRKQLTDTARRAGWTGCNILIGRIPEIGKVFYVKDGKINDKQKVLEQFNKIAFLKEEKVETKGWILDMMKCVDKIKTNDFSLQDAYEFEAELAKLHPGNLNVKPKIRQQLQILRDKKLVEFLGNGKYRRIV